MGEAGASDAQVLREQGDAMRDFNGAVVLLQDAIARSAGLNSVDLQVLGVLMQEGPTTPGALAARSGLSSGGAITALVDRLERAGYVTRRRDAADRRRVLVEAVDQRVLDAVGETYGRIARRWEQHLTTLPIERVAELTAALRVATALDREETDRLRTT